VRPARAAAGFRGTVRYASINAHKNREMGRLNLVTLSFELQYCCFFFIFALVGLNVKGNLLNKNSVKFRVDLEIVTEDQ
jgi:hypothetical protein